MKRLFILDLYMWIYTAYYAHVDKPLTSPSGEMTVGTYVFVKTLNKLIEKYQPDMICAASDLPGKTFRKKLYSGYKSSRPETMPEGICQQINRVKEILGIMKIPVYQLEGFEADDIIGTLVQKVKENPEKFEVFICTRDKDSLQLIDESVFVFDINKGIKTGLNEVKEKWGIEPNQFIDFLTLQGDVSDHVPGVPGIGPKSAVQLLNDWGDLNVIYNNLNALPKGIAKKLREGEELCKLSKELVTIRRDVPIEVNFSDMEYQGKVNINELYNVYEELGFVSMIKPFTNIGKRLI